MDSFSGACEIVESKDELNLALHFRGSNKTDSAMRMNSRDSKYPVSKIGHSKYLDDDLNQLFKSINIKTSSKSLDLSGLPSTESLRQKALKKPLGYSASNSPRSEITETVTLKKALRGLSISHASEMAAMKRLSKAACSPRVSEAERITSLYRSVVVENDEPNSFLYKGKESIIEMVVPEESSSNYSKKFHQIKSANQSTQSSPRIGIPPIPKVQEATQIKKVINPPLTHDGNENSKIGLKGKEKHPSVPSPSCHDNCEKSCDLGKDSSTATKLTKKVAAPKQGRKGRLNIASSSSSTNGNGLTKITRSNHRVVKTIIKNKNVVKKKMMNDLTSTACSSNVDNEVDADVEPVKRQMVCERCQCSLQNGKIESNSSPVSYGSKVPEICSIETTPVADSCNRNVDPSMKVNKDSKSKDKGEFSQSSKSSLGEYSTSTSASEESNLSRSSCGNRPHMSKDVRWEAIRLVRLQHGNLSLSHFNLIKKLGCGDIGTVYLAELIGANCLFAIKVMDNEYLARRKKMPRAQTEREILRILDHPFLPTLYSQFTSDNLSCLVMEYCPGGDLHVLRQKQSGRNFPEQAARFYVAEVLLALEYLHMLGVVYRDLKPENILVREDGHIMLTDFDLSLRCTVSPVLLNSSSSSAVLEPARMSGPCTGSSCIDPFCIEPYCKVSCFSPRVLPHTASKAKKIKAEQKTAQIRSSLQLIAEPTDARSNSFVGTHEYLAPEIIEGDGHGSAVDWWTFGIFLYELLYGKTPFKGSGNEETLTNVVLQPLVFPNSPLVSFQARDLIRGLLSKEPENRLGSERGAAEIKQHPFFEGLNWALIRCAIPPELPEIHDYGVGMFDSEEQKSKFLDFKNNGDHLEFEFF